MSDDNLQSLCHKSEIHDLTPLAFDVEGWSKKIILIKKRGIVYGWLDSCPHYSDGTPLAWKKNQYLNEDSSYLKCFAHGALFEIHSGLCVKGACIGRSLNKVELIEDEYGYVCVINSKN